MTNTDFIPVSQPFIDDSAKALVMDCLDSGWISSQGAYVTQFENDFAAYIGAEFAISVTSGTAALHLALIAIGIGPGDEVIVPDLTFAATANAVLLCGAKPVLCAIDEDTWTLDVQDCQQLVTSNTKAIIPVHLYGNPADMKAITHLAGEHGITVIEDCAESLGASVDDQYTGTMGEMGCFSFFANKLLSTGEGGMVTTNDAELAKKLRILRDHGMAPGKKYWHDLAGLNYRMTNIQAAIGVSQLALLDEFTRLRGEQERLYRQHLEGVFGIVFKSVLNGATSVNWLMSIRVDAENKSAESLRTWLAEHQVDSRPFFFPLHEQPPYRDERSALKATKTLSDSGLSLPTFIGLSNEQITRICELIKRYMGQEA
ncbi:DegT/DnrJ/EryC1/StrS family aminotransferase [Alteromonas confluentis]|uniref:GDP-perosamine synthase n=1 Tax=Alteromonas confluentis TaxID=1656094 RepID=A0A1E7Z5Y0_9ALTE|nr:DegT/DnrJ/EryC1/StrS family aminotransferase [Alteromonas confluentis]OFC68953.1 hypothetical protein BFC18_19610 [Alteromonas confluentis]